MYTLTTKTTDNTNTQINLFRFESGSVYKYSNEQDAYVFCGKLNGSTKKTFLKDLYEMELLG